MSLENEALVLDLIEWISRESKPYDEVMEAWRTSCPRLSVWEDALDAGLMERTSDQSGRIVVQISSHGRSFLQRKRSDLKQPPATATH